MKEKYHSVLLVAPPMQFTPYFLKDMMLGAPDGFVSGGTVFRLPVVFTFFPDNIYNAPIRGCKERKSGKEIVLDCHDVETWKKTFLPHIKGHDMSDEEVTTHLEKALSDN